MNANTALKINDAIEQAIRCGESTEAVLAQVTRALARALDERAETDPPAKPDYGRERKLDPTAPWSVIHQRAHDRLRTP